VLIVAFNRVIANQLRRAINARPARVPHTGDRSILTAVNQRRAVA
jgi:hypothetical protein